MQAHHSTLSPPLTTPRHNVERYSLNSVLSNSRLVQVSSLHGYGCVYVFVQWVVCLFTFHDSDIGTCMPAGVRITPAPPHICSIYSSE